MSPFEQLISWENLLLAYQRASQGKRGRSDVALFEHRLEDELFDLQRELASRAYRPGAYLNFYVHDPKRRLISAAPFRDRVVHHALCNLIEPPFERSFIDESFANRIGKGTHRALERAQYGARHYRYVLQLDVRQFFPSIDHALLREGIARKVSDPGLLWLIDAILESGRGVLDGEYRMVYFPGDDLFAVERPRGLPIGNLTSQFWANVYLNPLDHFVKRELHCPCYARYVDDLLLFADDKRTLWEWKTRLEQRFAALRLTLHPGAHPHPVGEGIPFLGFVVYPDRRGLKRRKGIAFRRRLAGLLDDLERGGTTDEEVAAQVDGWWNHVRYANTTGLARAVLQPLPGAVRGLLTSPRATLFQDDQGAR